MERTLPMDQPPNGHRCEKWGPKLAHLLVLFKNILGFLPLCYLICPQCCRGSSGRRRFINLVYYFAVYLAVTGFACKLQILNWSASCANTTRTALFLRGKKSIVREIDLLVGFQNKHVVTVKLLEYFPPNFGAFLHCNANC